MDQASPCPDCMIWPADQNEALTNEQREEIRVAAMHMHIQLIIEGKKQQIAIRCNRENDIYLILVALL